MAEEWYFAHNNERFGPHSTAELSKLAASGQLKPDDLVWNESMPQWKPAATVPGLFGAGASSPDGSKKASATTAGPQSKRDDVLKAAGEVSGKVAQAGRGFMSKIADMADRAGNFAGEALIYDQTLAADAHKPAIFLQELYFGGRRNIGTSLAMLNTLGGVVLSLLFSFLYIGYVLRASLSSWQFLPYSKTELVRITLRQKVRWEKLLPIVVGWVITMAVGITICFFWTALIAGIGRMTQPGDNFFGKLLVFLASLSIPVLVAFYLFANYVACKKTARLENYTRSCILLDYGFPNKTRLLMGVSDAPLEKQIDGVLALCDAISRANFAPLESLGANRNFGIRTFLASLMRRITGQ
ncbi:MAG: DUF4339 domain-containing protein [Planctomycetes bacterium]|nr:DUF4339 domain-containing protein [Planctomycetota bacterium]